MRTCSMLVRGLAWRSVAQRGLGSDLRAPAAGVTFCIHSYKRARNGTEEPASRELDVALGSGRHRKNSLPAEIALMPLSFLYVLCRSKLPSSPGLFALCIFAKCCASVSQEPNTAQQRTVRNARERASSRSRTVGVLVERLDVRDVRNAELYLLR